MRTKQEIVDSYIAEQDRVNWSDCTPQSEIDREDYKKLSGAHEKCLECGRKPTIDCEFH